MVILCLIGIMLIIIFILQCCCINKKKLNNPNTNSDKLDQLLESEAIKIKKIREELTHNKENKKFVTGRIQAIRSEIRNRRKSVECGIKLGRWKFVNLKYLPKYAWKQCSHSHLDSKVFNLSQGYFDMTVNQYIFPGENTYCYCYYKPCID